jgi:NitT/TauT family transport system substrate-binding protein
MYFKVLLFTICVFLTSCTEQVQAPLRIGTNTWPGYEPLYVTQKKSAEFQKQIKFVEYRNASQVLNGMINNSIDVAAVTLDEAVKIKALGYDIQVVWIIDESYGADALMSINSRTIDELKGKKIGVETSALGAYFLKRFLEKNQLSKSEFEIVNLEVNRHFESVTQGKVDAVLTFDPVKSKLLEVGGNNLFDSKQIPGEIIDVLIVNKRYFSQEQKAVLRAFLKESTNTVSAINQNITPYYHSLNSRLKLSEQQFFETYKQIKLFELSHVKQWFSELEKQEKLVRRYSDVLFEEHIISKSCDCKGIISTELLDMVKNEK